MSLRRTGNDCESLAMRTVTLLNLFLVCGHLCQVTFASVSRCNAVQFTFSCTLVDPPVITHFASVTSSQLSCHSTFLCSSSVASYSYVTSLQEVIDSFFGDHAMWDRFSFDDDGTRLLHALLNASLINVHEVHLCLSVPPMPARVLPCVTVAPPTSELLDLLPKRVKMLLFPHEQVVVMDGRQASHRQ
eukprot:scaffold5382_cov79-Skeletonema_dohrnii-CCMP3373.AAC.1